MSDTILDDAKTFYINGYCSELGREFETFVLASSEAQARKKCLLDNPGAEIADIVDLNEDD